MDYSLPPNSSLVGDRNDIGRTVEVNSVGGCFKDEQGTVLFGPFDYYYSRRFLKKTKRGESWSHESGVSGPWYIVELHNWHRSWMFKDTEVHVLNTVWLDSVTTPNCGTTRIPVI